jgi:hypothetical protein
MKAQPTKQILAMLLCLMAVACGSSRDDHPNHSTEPPKEATRPTIPVEAPPADPFASNRNRTDDSADPTSSSGQAGQPGRPGPSASVTEREKERDREKNRQGVEPQENTATGTQFDEPVTDQEIANIQNESRRYSGSVNDGLREYLMSQMDQVVDPVQRGRNLRFAFSIIDAKLRPIENSKRLQLKIKILQMGKEKESDRERVLTFSGALGLQKKSNRLELISGTKGKDGKFHVQANQKATLICMDANRPKMLACQTKVARVFLNNAYVQIILRTATVHTQAEFPKRTCYTPECEDAYGIFKYTMDGTQNASALKSAVMDTAEIIQGKSTFNILLVTNDGEALKFAGPLSNPEFYPTTNTPVDTELSSDERVDASTKTILKSNIAKTFRDVRLRRNDGNGTLLIDVLMKVLENGERDNFQMAMSREIAPIRAYLEDKSLEGVSFPKQATPNAITQK